LKVAIIHYWLLGMRGGEKVLESLCNLFPSADIYTHVYNPENISDVIKKHNIITTEINKLPFASRLYQKYLLLMPNALEKLDLKDYDLILSSESGPAKGIIAPPNSIHICYCHSPMRYLWNMYFEYYNNAGYFSKIVMKNKFKDLRVWDFISAQRVDAFIANSYNVQKRIKCYYRRDAYVIHPPIDLKRFYISPNKENYYFILSELVHYKRVDIAIKAFNTLNLPLLIAGKGSEEKKLKKIANKNIQFLGRISDTEVIEYLSRAKAFIFPGEEDFGIAPLESMASGVPVIAYAKGGALETVVDNITGIFFKEQNEVGLINAVQEFETKYNNFDPVSIRRHAENFDITIFEKNVYSLIMNIYNTLLK